MSGNGRGRGDDHGQRNGRGGRQARGRKHSGTTNNNTTKALDQHASDVVAEIELAKLENELAGDATQHAKACPNKGKKKSLQKMQHDGAVMQRMRARRGYHELEDETSSDLSEDESSSDEWEDETSFDLSEDENRFSRLSK